jgi:predicted dehydrogenase
MIEAAERAGVRLYVAENEPYTPRARMLRDLVRSGEPIGEVTFASLTLGHRMPTFAYPGRRAWLGQPELGGSGTWLLHGVHYVAHLRYVLGEVATVYMGEHKASSFQRRDVEGTMHGLLTLESGVPVAVAVSSETRVPEALRGYVIHGERGSLRATWERCEVFLSGSGGGAGGAGRSGGTGGADRTILEYPEERPSAYALELEAFADYVAGASEGPTTGRSERRSLAVVQAGYESARCGLPVRLRERFGPL